MYQKGFSLIEIMVVIAIISILSAVAIPGYQTYMQKAAMTDVLQSLLPYKSNIELCSIDEGDFSKCDSGKSTIPNDIKGKYITKIAVKSGVITLTTKKILNGLTITLTPQLPSTVNVFQWTVACVIDANEKVKSICEKTLQFNKA